MIEGFIDDREVPVILLKLAGRTWVCTIDTGFNGYLELPEELRDVVSAKYIGTLGSILAGARVVEEDHFNVRFPFDGELLRATATFAPCDVILIGTLLLAPYRLTIDFPARRVWLERE